VGRERGRVWRLFFCGVVDGLTNNLVAERMGWSQGSGAEEKLTCGGNKLKGSEAEMEHRAGWVRGCNAMLEQKHEPFRIHVLGEMQVTLRYVTGRCAWVPSG
jgi:hypothetical protein